MILSNLLFYLILKVLVVAGGSFTPKGRHPPQRSSTEILTVDSNSWKVLNQRGFSLPMLHAMASVSTEASLLIFGMQDCKCTVCMSFVLVTGGRSEGQGQSDPNEDGVPRTEILLFNGTWYEIGNLNTGRAYAAATKMSVDTTGALDLTKCN